MKRAGGTGKGVGVAISFREDPKPQMEVSGQSKLNGQRQKNTQCVQRLGRRPLGLKESGVSSRRVGEVREEVGEMSRYSIGGFSAEE